jgi:5-methylcytosine-specific restriction enzyme B
LTEERIELLWRHSVMPYLEERFFGDEEQRSEYELEVLRAAVADVSPPDDDAVRPESEPSDAEPAPFGD